MVLQQHNPFIIIDKYKGKKVRATNSEPQQAGQLHDPGKGVPVHIQQGAGGQQHRSERFGEGTNVLHASGTAHRFGSLLT
jgi:hypothetical protein